MSTLDEFFGPKKAGLPALPKRATFVLMTSGRVVVEHGRSSREYRGSMAAAMVSAYEAGQWRPQLPGRSRNGTPIMRR